MRPTSDRINWAHPLARGLTFCWIPQIDPRRDLSGVLTFDSASYKAATVFEGTKYGPGVQLGRNVIGTPTNALPHFTGPLSNTQKVSATIYVERYLVSGPAGVLVGKVFTSNGGFKGTIYSGKPPGPSSPGFDTTFSVPYYSPAAGHITQWADTTGGTEFGVEYQGSVDTAANGGFAGASMQTELGIGANRYTDSYESCALATFGFIFLHNRILSPAERTWLRLRPFDLLQRSRTISLAPVPPGATATGAGVSASSLPYASSAVGYSSAQGSSVTATALLLPSAAKGDSLAVSGSSSATLAIVRSSALGSSVAVSGSVSLPAALSGSTASGGASSSSLVVTAIASLVSSAAAGGSVASSGSVSAAASVSSSVSGSSIVATSSVSTASSAVGSSAVSASSQAASQSLAALSVANGSGSLGSSSALSGTSTATGLVSSSSSTGSSQVVSVGVPALRVTVTSVSAMAGAEALGNTSSLLASVDISAGFAGALVILTQTVDTLALSYASSIYHASFSEPHLVVLSTRGVMGPPTKFQTVRSLKILPPVRLFP